MLIFVRSVGSSGEAHLHNRRRINTARILLFASYRRASGEASPIVTLRDKHLESVRLVFGLFLSCFPGSASILPSRLPYHCDGGGVREVLIFSNINEADPGEN